MPESNADVIKQPIAFRARFRFESKKVVPPFEVVPHPVNRGGDPVNLLRTQELIRSIFKDGYDPIEANSNGALVEIKPA
eukprot:862443-Pyramimonas_sp.AAC.1